MKRLLIIVFAACCLPLSVDAQTNQELKDSVSWAIGMLDTYPDSLPLRMKKASWNMLLGEWQRAKDEYDFVISRDPLLAPAFFYRAYANEKLRLSALARQDYNSYLKLMPNDMYAHLGLVVLNQKDKRYAEAFDQVNRLVQQFPDSALVYATRGNLELEQGLKELAEYDYSKAIEKDPAATDYLLSRVEVRLQLGRKKEAREDLDRLVRLGVSRANLQYYFMRAK
ncbi:MAG: tetratricopeptide repeat protein [Prevotella sp.]|nr:tetratricopeptide repeat protein [Prevotella sp.]